MRFILLAITLFTSDFVLGQNQISGILKNPLKNPIEYANVLLYQKADTLKIIQGTTTDSTGQFRFSGINNGAYLLKSHCIGYKANSLQIEKLDNQDLFINSIVLEDDITFLNAITVTAKKELIQKTTTGFVVNADATLSQQGGSAVDLLRNTPTIFVDAEGSVNLRGKSPMILINGRNSKLDNLNALPANSIEKIEVITTPGASYDAEAENGIINIILKKGKADGLNGAVAVGSGVGYSWRLNNSAMLNYKKRNWNIGLSYDNRLAERNRKAEGDRENFNLPEQYFLTQRRNDIRNEGIHNLRANLDYTNKKDAFGAELLLGFEKETNFETLFNTTENKERVFQSKSKRYSDERRNEKSSEIALKYERKLKIEGQKLSANASMSFNNGLENTGISTQSLTDTDVQIGSLFLQRTSFTDNNSVSNFRLDYLQKAGKGVFETGYKALLRSFSNDFGHEDQLNGNYVFVANRTGTLNFNEWVNAFYALYKLNSDTQWDYEIGLRAEQTNNKGLIKNLGVDFENNYLNLFPTVNIGYNIAENQNIRISYEKRINRPSLGQLNPFTDITDSLTQRSGNPNLLPEISNNMELGYSKNFNKGSFLSKIYYRNSQNSILPFTVLRNDGVLFTQPLNAGTTQTTGIETIFTIEPNKYWQTNWSVSLFNQQIDAKNINAEALNTVLSWNTKWINDFTLWNKAKLQVIGVYNSPTATIQGNRIAVYNVDAAFQQRIWKDKARLGLIVTDIFNTQKNGFTWETKDFNFSRIFKVDTRAVLLTFAYTFGTSFKEKLMENKFSND
ncbi:MAG: TonB-dependent receptor [Leadbetterella sp.]|jgi:outer membrane receptor protein involved in Fe transport|nr:TonB-dependent receptor [Leadbetterella sp.]